MNKIKRLTRIRIHHEGTHALWLSGICVLAVCGAGYWLLGTNIAFFCIAAVLLSLYAILVNFYRCPIRLYNGSDTEHVIVAPADGKVVVIEEVEENEYFHDRRIMVSIFMSLVNVHANWFPIDGVVKSVKHEDGNYHKAFLPKACIENERSTIVIETKDHGDIIVRQVAGAMARRIVTYAHEGDACYIDEHLGFIKLGSRVDLFLPLDAKICVKMGQSTTGNNTVIARFDAK